MPTKPSYKELEQRVYELERAESELAKAMNALQESETRFRLLYERSPIAYQSLDIHGHLIEVNQAWLDILGFEKREVIGKSFGDFLHPDWVNHFKQNFPIFKAVGEILGVEFEMVKKNRAKVFVSFEGKIGKDKDGNFQQTHCVLHDITERKQAEEALHSERDRAQKYLDTVDAIIVALNSEGQITLINQKGCRLLGYSENDLIGRTWFSECLPQPEGMDNVYPVFLKLIAGEIAIAENYENPIITKNGELRQIAWHNALLHDEKETVVGILSAGEDITDRKIAENALRESEDKYRSLVESTFDWVWSIDIDGVHTYSNDAIKKSLGYSREDIIGSSAFPIMHPDDSCRWKVKLQECIDLKTGWKDENIRWLRKGGEIHFFESSANPILDKSGNVVGFRGVDRDITERKKLEAQLLQAQKMEAIGNLAGGIAHDFNNILASIIGFTELSLDAVEKNTILEDNLKEVYSASQRARDLVKQILAFARQSDEEHKPVQLGRIVKEVLKFMRSTLPTTIEIKHLIESESFILGNATQVYQVLMNLFTNAAQAMEKDGGTLNVSISDILVDKIAEIDQSTFNGTDYIELKLSDTGVGIAQDKIDHIFEPYFTTKPHGQGTGMGLALVKGVVEGYGGQIFVHSIEGDGSTFKIYLPATQERKKERAYQQKELPTGREQILFVDDEAPLAKAGERILSNLGYTVTICTSSVEAKALFRSKPNEFDLVITDMTMPNITGDHLAMELLSIRPDLPVILCTGYSNNISGTEASKIGIKAFVYKPIVQAELAQTIRAVLDGRKEMQSTACILLIDDDPQIRKLFERELSGKGYKIISARDGNEGLKRYHEHRPDLVITDLVMPEKEGIETINILKKTDPDVKIIAISGGGWADPHTYLQIAEKTGADKTFSKPIDWPRLIKAIKELLNSF